MSMDMTREELAKLAGKTYRQIYNINKRLSEESADKALFVSGEDAKKCDAATFVQRWVAYNIDINSVDADDLDAVKAQHESVKMRKTQLEVDRMEGTLVDVQDIRKLWGNIMHTVVRRFLNLANTLAPKLRGMENVELIHNIIDADIRKELEEVSETPLPAYLLLEDEEKRDENGQEP